MLSFEEYFVSRGSDFVLGAGRDNCLFDQKSALDQNALVFTAPGP